MGTMKIHFPYIHIIWGRGGWRVFPQECFLGIILTSEGVVPRRGFLNRVLVQIVTF